MELKRVTKPTFKAHYALLIIGLFAAIKCPRLRRPNYGEIYPSVCGERRMHFGERCAFACRAGFELQGPTLRECLTPGDNNPIKLNKCKITHKWFCLVSILSNSKGAFCKKLDCFLKPLKMTTNFHIKLIYRYGSLYSDKTKLVYFRLISNSLLGVWTGGPLTTRCVGKKTTIFNVQRIV